MRFFHMEMKRWNIMFHKEIVPGLQHRPLLWFCDIGLLYFLSGEAAFFKTVQVLMVCLFIFYLWIHISSWVTYPSDSGVINRQSILCWSLFSLLPDWLGKYCKSLQVTRYPSWLTTKLNFKKYIYSTGLWLLTSMRTCSQL